VLPGRINDRPPAFKGRNELGLSSPTHPFVAVLIALTETLLASDDSRDWVKISEMFLGPAPEAWTFLPKHKSNSYESQG
jgi:tRNA-dihydrouridine synthase 3